MSRHFRGDRAPWQSDDYIDANYEADEHNEPRGGEVSEEIKAAVRSAYKAAGRELRGRSNA